MQEIPLVAYPSREFRVLLDAQECTIALYQRDARMYLDLAVGDIRACTGAVCLDGASVVQAAQSVFSGSLHFVDLQGREAPQWEGLGTRWILLYASAGEELPARLQY